MNKLYPLTSSPIIKTPVWGREDWLWSDLEGNRSVISNGFLQGNNINELTEVYLSDLVGEKNYDVYGEDFPLLIKFLDIQEYLSVQVHPNDEIAKNWFNSYGKTEMWYVMEAKEEACLYLGFNRDLTAAELYEHCEKETLHEVMNCLHPKKGECYFIPAGCVHAAGGGLKIAEVQQSSDITFRIYDWGREHNPQTAREMHLDVALEAIDYSRLEPKATTSGELCSCRHFTVRYYKESRREFENTSSNSFLIYIGLEGNAKLEHKGVLYPMGKGESLLVPASLSEWEIRTDDKSEAEFLEVFV